MRYYILKFLRFILPCDIVGDYYEPNWLYKVAYDILKSK